MMVCAVTNEPNHYRVVIEQPEDHYTQTIVDTAKGAVSAKMHVDTDSLSVSYITDCDDYAGRKPRVYGGSWDEGISPLSVVVGLVGR